MVRAADPRHRCPGAATRFRLAPMRALGRARVATAAGSGRGAPGNRSKAAWRMHRDSALALSPARRGRSAPRRGGHGGAARARAPRRCPPTARRRDPMVDALARESRSSVLLLKQASAADLVRDAPWREYLVRRALEFDARQPRCGLRDGCAAPAVEAAARGAAVLRASSRHGRRRSADAGPDRQVLHDLGRFAEAEATLRRALALSDDAVGGIQPRLRAGAGGTGGRGGTSLPAGAHLEPRAGRARTNLGTALAARGRFTDAVGHLAEAVRARTGQRRRAQQPRRRLSAAAADRECRTRVPARARG